MANGNDKGKLLEKWSLAAEVRASIALGAVVNQANIKTELGLIADGSLA